MSLRATLARSVPAALADETLDRLEALDRLLCRWGKAVDLEGFGSVEERHRRYFAEPLNALSWLPERGRALDIGSGGGSPALPLAVAQADVTWTLVESNERKAMFLQEAVRALGLDSAQVVRARYEGWHGAGTFDAVTVRGVGLTAPVREKIRSELDASGRWLWFTSEARLVEAKQWRGWRTLGGPIPLSPGGGFLGVLGPSG